MQQTELSILKPFDIQKEELQKVANDYRNLVVTEETLEEAKKARKVMRDHRINIQDILKGNKSILNKEKSNQEQKAEELINILEPTESYLDAGIKAIENKKEEEKKRKEQEAMLKITQRTNSLTELNMKFVEGVYVLGENSISPVQIKVFSDEEFNSFVDLVKKEVAIIEQKKLEEEERVRQQQAQMEQQRLEQEAESKRLEAIRKEQEEKEIALKQQQEAIEKKAEEARLLAEKELKDKQEAFEKQKRQQEAELFQQHQTIARRQQEILNETRKQREAQLVALGYVFNESNESFERQFISDPNDSFSLVNIIKIEQLAWDLLLEDRTKAVLLDQQKAEETKIALEKELKDKQEALDRLAAIRAEELKTDIEKLNTMLERFGSIEYVTGLKDAKSQQVLSDVMKMNEGIQEFIRLSITHL